MDHDAVARILVGYSTGVRTGEVVSLLGPPAVEPLLLALYREVLRAGGQPMVLMRPEPCDDLLAEHGDPAQLAFVDPLLQREVESADVAMHVLPVPVREATVLEPSRLGAVHASRRPLLDRFLRRVAEGTLRWTATVYPRWPDWLGTPDHWRNQLLRSMFLDQTDPIATWNHQRERQARLIGFLEGVRELQFVTPAGTNLRVGVASCRWHNGDGHENLPDGEVWTCPVQDSVEGDVGFDFPVVVGSQVVHGIRLQFRAGRVVSAAAAQGQGVLQAMLAGDASARRVGEIALGCNYAITQRMGHPLIDEKTGGTFHIALGEANRSGIHLDLIADQRQGGRIEADGRPINVNGRFVDPEWPL